MHFGHFFDGIIDSFQAIVDKYSINLNSKSIITFLFYFIILKLKANIYRYDEYIYMLISVGQQVAFCIHNAFYLKNNMNK